MNVDFKTSFGKRLRYLRRLRDISQEQLAESVDLSRHHIGLLETGKASPSFEALGKLSIALDVELIELFNFENLPLDRLRSK